MVTSMASLATSMVTVMWNNGNGTMRGVRQKENEICCHCIIGRRAAKYERNNAKEI